MGLTRPELRSERRTCCWRSWLANELPRCRRWLQRSRPTRIAGYAEINTPLVIQGGPGTGKTIVGLHRAAYLLYQLRRQGQESSVLVIGPNPAFMEYIGSVLPSLGESTATQLSLEDLPLAHLTAKEKPLVRTRATVAPAVAQLLGDLRMAAAVEGAIRKSVKAEALRLGFGRYVLRLDVAKVSEVLEHLVGRSESYLEGRRGLTNGLAEAFFEQYILRGPPGASGDQQLELIAASTRQLLSEGDLGKRLMPPLEARRLVIGLLDDLELLQEAGFDSAEAGLLHQRSRTRAYPWALEHLPLLDEAARHVRGVPTRFAHVVVDEAQDLSPMQWRMVLEAGEASVDNDPRGSGSGHVGLVASELERGR